MKLQQLSEVDMNRRNFLQGTGAILTKLLIGGGMPAELAQQFSKSKIISVMASHFSYDDNRAEDVIEFIKSATNLAQSCGTNALEMYDSSYGAGDSITYGTTISQNKLIELLKNNKYQVLDDELEIELPGSTCSIKFDEIEDGIPVSVNQMDLLRTWWQNYGSYSIRPIDNVFGNILKKAGIDPSKTIQDFTRESIADEWLQSPEERAAYGDLRKYGFSKQEIAKLQHAAKEMETQEVEPVKAQVNNKDQDIQNWENEGGYATESRSFSDRLKALLHF